MTPLHASGASIGNWSLDWRLGEGSSAIVYRCVNARGVVAAMKLARDPLARPRLEREASVLERGLHGALPTLLERLDGGFVMELIQGTSLREMVLDAASAAGIGAQLARALASLHAAGLAHGDLSPQNVLIDRSGATRLIDLAGVCPASEVNRAQHTPGFQPPEADPRGLDQDRYALGKLLDGLIDGPRPPALEATLASLLSPDPARRPAMEQVAAALDPLATRTGAVVAATLAEAAAHLPIEAGAFGRYTLERRRGRGAMGEVWQAQDSVLRRSVALKVGWSEEARYLREARALAALDHPRLVRLLDFGQQEGRPFLAMDLVEGPSLKARLQSGPLPEAELLPLAIQLAEGLAAVHRAGLMHRDLKPANILLAEDGPKLADFGLATSTEGSLLTQTGTRLGTPAYMAPEQARGEPLTPAADVYGLGATLYRALSGERPYDGDDPVRVLAQVSEGHAPTLKVGSPGMQALVSRCMAARPQDRPQDGQALLEALQALAAGQEIRAPSALLPWLRRRRGLLLGGASLSLVALATAWTLSGRDARLAERERLLQDQQVQELELQAAGLRERDPQAALRLLEEGLEAPHLRDSEAAAGAWLRHARGLEEQGDVHGANLARSRAFIHHPEPERVLAELGSSLLDQGRREDARHVGWILADQPEPSPESQALILSARVASGDLAVAEGPLGSVLAALDRTRLADEPPDDDQPLSPDAPTIPGVQLVAELPDGTGVERISAPGSVEAEDESGRTRVLVEHISGEHPVLALAQLDPGGAPELVVPSGAWGPFDLRVYDTSGPAPYALRMRLPVGHVTSLETLPRAQGDLLLVPLRHLYGSRDVFPVGDPEGLGAGLHVLALEGGRLQVLDSFMDEQGYYYALRADVDGDGQLEGFIQGFGHLLVIAEREGTLHHQWVSGIEKVLVLGDLDGDGDDELMALVGDQWLLLGTGDAPFPRSEAPPSTQVEQPQVRRAVQLDELGLHEASISELERLMADPELGALAAWELGGVHQRAHDRRRAEAAWNLAVEDPERAQEALHALAVNAWEDKRAGDALQFAQRYHQRFPDAEPLPVEQWSRASRSQVELDFRGGIPPEVWVRNHGLRVEDDGLHIARTQESELLRIPLEWDGRGPVRVELDLDVERIEWGSGLKLSLVDSEGGWFMAQVFGMGGSGAVASELNCGNATRRRPHTLLPQDSAFVEISGLLTLALDPEQGACHHPAWPGRIEVDMDRQLEPGRLELVLGSSSYGSANEARSVLRGIQLHGVQLLTLPEPDPDLRAAANGELLEDGGLETRMRRLMSQGRRDAVEALWRKPEVTAFAGALLRERPDLWLPVLWSDPTRDPLEVYGSALIGPLAQQPNDPELADEVLELRQLDDTEHHDDELLAWLLYFRGHALLQRGDLSTARQLLERSMALHPLPLHTGRALVEVELAAGDPDLAMDLALQLIADTGSYTVADHLAGYPTLQPLREHPRWPELVQARALEEPAPPR